MQQIESATATFARHEWCAALEAGQGRRTCFPARRASASTAEERADGTWME
jgi:hypothetical protein